MLDRWQTLIEDLKRLQKMKDTLSKMKGELSKCYKL